MHFICFNLETDNTSVYLNGNGFLKFSHSFLINLPITGQDVFGLRFKTRSPNGLLLWKGKKDRSDMRRHFLFLSMQDGQVVFRYDSLLSVFDFLLCLGFIISMALLSGMTWKMDMAA
jgi:Laminin G domain